MNNDSDTPQDKVDNIEENITVEPEQSQVALADQEYQNNDPNPQDSGSDLAEDSKSEQPPIATNNSAETSDIIPPDNPGAPKKPKNNKRMMLIVSALIILIGLGVAVYLIFIKKDPKNENVTDNSQQVTEIAKTEEAPKPNDGEFLNIGVAAESENLANLEKISTGEILLDTPELIKDSVSDPQNQNFINTNPKILNFVDSESRSEMSVYNAAAKVTKIGTIKDKDLYFYESLYTIDYPSAIYSVDANNKITIYNKFTDENFKANWGVNLPASVEYTDDLLDSLFVPTNIFTDSKTKNINLTAVYDSFTGTRMFGVDRTGKSIKLRTIGKLSLYKYEKEDEQGILKTVGYSLQTPGSLLSVDYKYQPFDMSYASLKITKPTNISDEQKKSNYVPITYGCGAGSYGATSVILNASAGRFKEIGTSSNGKKVYTFSSNGDVLLQKAYDEYADFFKDSTQSVDVLSKQAFYDLSAVLVYQDPAGEWMIFVLNTYRPFGGCAKPVIYLYPEVATDFKVKVGANVTVSEPNYPVSGWTGRAFPDGKLQVQGQNYRSLFWEGQGFGSYPIIDSGKIIETKDIKNIISQDLEAQNLNSQEINDFLEYWTTKVDFNKKYTRMSWLTKAEIDKLAPLDVSPKPQTSIRVFLDMKGVDQPYNIRPQMLTKTERKGYTLVEWGGLANFPLK